MTMTLNRSAYGALSRLLDYPKAGFCEAAEEWVAQIANECPKAGEALQPFIAYLAEGTAEQLEELYCLTFDNNPTAALELGWHLYGEAYERGSFLVAMRQVLREHNIDERSELPDHLSSVLQAMSVCDDKKAFKLATEAVKPAVRKIIVSLTAGQNPYEPVLDAVLEVVRLHIKETHSSS